MIMYMFVLVVKQSHTYSSKMCSCMWVYQVHAGQLQGRITSDTRDKNNEKSASRRIWFKTWPSCHRMRQFTPTASKSSKRFLPGGWKTLLHLTGMSWTGIDLLSACIWTSMAHMPGGDAATRLNCLLFITAWSRCKASQKWKPGPWNGIKKRMKRNQ